MRVNFKETLPRVIADLAVIHVAAILSLFVSLYIHLNSNRGVDIGALLESIESFYFTRFLPLSAIFRSGMCAPACISSQQLARRRETRRRMGGRFSARCRGR